jgi:hypothetical protein
MHLFILLNHFIVFYYNMHNIHPSVSPLKYFFVIYLYLFKSNRMLSFLVSISVNNMAIFYGHLRAVFKFSKSMTSEHLTKKLIM